MRSAGDRSTSGRGGGQQRIIDSDEKQGRPTYYIIIRPSRVVVPIIRLDLFFIAAERCERVSETMSDRASAAPRG